MLVARRAIQPSALHPSKSLENIIDYKHFSYLAIYYITLFYLLLCVSLLPMCFLNIFAL